MGVKHKEWGAEKNVAAASEFYSSCAAFFLPVY